MAKFIVVVETKENVCAPITQLQNILAEMKEPLKLPEGLELISNTAFLVEFPKCALFFAKLLVALDKEKYSYEILEIADVK